MFEDLKEDWRLKRDAMKQHILEMYKGTNETNRKELYDFLEFVINNYDLDDAIYEQIKEDMGQDKETNEMSNYEFESLEYEYNILRGRRI